MQLKRTSSENRDFIQLVECLDADLAERDGNEHSFYAQFNKISTIQHVVVMYDGETAVGCGAMKEYARSAMEVKRMYTSPAHRGRGIASAVLAELEKWAAELGYERCVLETGKKQPEAIALYGKNGYCLVPNYGQYVGVVNSVCFGKSVGDPRPDGKIVK